MRGNKVPVSLRWISFLTGTLRSAFAVVSILQVGFATYSQAAVVNVAVSGFTFNPPTVGITVGDTVHWTGLSANHNVVEVSQTTWNANGTTPLPGGFQSGSPGTVATFDFTFSGAMYPPGTYYYVCQQHVSGFGMKGTVIVNPPPTPSQTPTPSPTPSPTPTPTPPPPSDNCSNATLIFAPSVNPGDTTNSSHDGSSSCDGLRSPVDVWFEFIPASSGFYSLEDVPLFDTPPTVLSVHTGCPGTAANEIACDNPIDGSIKLSLFLTQGTAYFIRVAEFSGPESAFNLILNALAGPDISVTPTALPFPDKITTGGPTAYKTVAITNVGDADLTISGIGITGANPADFIITFDSGPPTLPPGGTRTLRVVFDPNDPPGMKSANLSILSNDPDEQTVNVALTGKGLAVPPQRFGYYPATDSGRGHAYFIDKSPPFGVQSYKIELRRVDNTNVIFHQAIINLAAPPTGDVVGSTEFDLPRINPAIPTSYEADLQYRFSSYDGLNATGNILYQSAFAFGSHPSADVTMAVFNNPPVTASNESFTLTDERPTGPVGYPTGNATAGYTYEIVSQNQTSGVQTILGQLDHGYAGSFATTAVHPATQRTKNVNVPHGNQVIYVRVRRTYISGEGSVLGKFEVAHRSPLLYFNIP